MMPVRPSAEERRGQTFSVEKDADLTVLRFHWREHLAGTDLSLLQDLWPYFEPVRPRPTGILAMFAAPGLLSTRSLEDLVGKAEVPAEGRTHTLPSGEVSERLVREANVIERLIEGIRNANEFVVGVVQEEVALPLLTPLLACDYRIATEETVFVNTTRELPRVPLGALPWFLVHLAGAAKASEILLERTTVSAIVARELGLLNHLTSMQDPEGEAMAAIERLLELPRAALIGIKRSMRAAREQRPPTEHVS